jgi:tRNA G18 (ribose-2'-O)-methylase SpoU
MDESIALEGAFLIERALSAGLEFEALYCVPAREAWAKRLRAGAAASSAGCDASSPASSIEPVIMPEPRISEIAGYRFHRGAFALAHRPPARAASEIIPSSDGPATMLVLPEIGDPENLGAAFRNAAAFGCSALLLGPTGPDPYCRRVLRVSMGAALSLPWARLEGPASMRALGGLGFRAVACVLDPEARELRAWKRPERLALVLGNEASGLSAPWLEACDERVTLKMMGNTDSLNLATAAAIFLYATAAPQEASNARAV